MGEKSGADWRRRFNRLAPLVTAALGMLVIASSMGVRNLTLWYLTIIAGLLLILGGFWYAANPILTSERRFHALRAEVDDFITLVRRLNAAATQPEARQEFEKVKADMMASVERMARLAGKEGQTALDREAAEHESRPADARIPG